MRVSEVWPEGMGTGCARTRTGPESSGHSLSPVWGQRGAGGGSARPGDPPAGTFRGSSWGFGRWEDYPPWQPAVSLSADTMTRKTKHNFQKKSETIFHVKNSGDTMESGREWVQ